MALNTYTDYITALNTNLTSDFQTSAVIGRPARLSAAWRYFLPAPATPTTSVALTSASDVAIGTIPSVGAGQLRVMGSRMYTSVSGVAGILVDLLNQSGGLSGTSTSPQTTNLPTAALTRSTSGEGVMAGLVIYTAIGSTAVTVTISYTNQSGTSGRTSLATQIGGTNYSAIGTLIPIPLAAGDTGVRSVQSVTLSATSGTAGNFGVCLFRPLQMIAINDVTGSMPFDAVSTGGVIGSFANIDSNACLSLMTIGNTAQIVNGAFILAEV